MQVLNNCLFFMINKRMAAFYASSLMVVGEFSIGALLLIASRISSGEPSSQSMGSVPVAAANFFAVGKELILILPLQISLT